MSKKIQTVDIIDFNLVSYQYSILSPPLIYIYRGL